MNRWIRIPSLMIIDAILLTLSIYAAYLLRFDFNIPNQFPKTFPYVMSVYLVLTLMALYIFKIYKRYWQYASVGDLISIFKGVLLSAGIFFILHHYIIHAFYPQIVIPRSIYLLTTMIAFLAVGGSRFLWRILRDSYRKMRPDHRRALVVGAGEAGIMVVKELKHSPSEFYPVAFIDDQIHKQGFEVVGVPVVGTRTAIPAAVEKYKIDIIILALPSASRMEIAAILDICKQTKCKIKIIPRVNDLINGKISVKMIRDVSVLDLLGREQVQVDLKEVANYLNGQKVLITGAGGSIGSELCRQIATFQPKQLLLLGRGENSIYEIETELHKKFPDLSIEPLIADIQHKQRLEAIFKQFRPQVVFHAAAHKHVPLMEKNPLEAIKNNILGTKNLAECAHQYQSERFVMISTDKAVNPTSVMGASKRAAEMVVQGLNQISQTRFSSVRFGNVLGSRGSVIPAFKKQIAEGGPVTVTHPDMIRYFMTIPEAVQLVIQAGAFADGGEIFVLDMGQPVKIADLARDLIRLSGLEPEKDVKIVYTGIRPGEKLFEELMTNEEGTAATKHDRIFIGRSSEVSSDQVNIMLRRMEYLVLKKEQSKPIDIQLELHHWVPSYQVPYEKTIDFQPTADQALRASLEVLAGIENK